MLNPKEMALVYKDILKCFKETMLLTPKDTIAAVLKLHSFSDVAETFAALARIKERDGRIYGENREWLKTIPVARECYDWQNPECRHNEFLRLNHDEMHPTHINQLVTVLREMKKAGEAEGTEGGEGEKPANKPKYYNKRVKENSMKYLKERQRTVLVRFRREDFENRIAPAMERAGLPMATFIKQAIDEKIKRDRLL